MENWSKIEFIFCFKLHIDPLILRDLEYYTIQNILKEYEEHVEKENREYEKQNKEIERQQKQIKLGSTNTNFQPPKFDIPKYDLPKH